MNTIALYSSQPILAAGFGLAVAPLDGFALVSIHSTLSDLKAAMTFPAPTLIVAELTSDLSIEELKTLVTAAPKSRVILWAGDISPEFASQAISAGVRGILRRTLSTEAHLECLRRVAEGELWLEKSLTDAVLSGRRISLTRRERELMALLAQGLKNKEMGYLMGITEGTVKVYLSRLFQKVGANDRLDLALFALRNLRADGAHVVQPTATVQPTFKAAPVLYFPSQVHRPAA